MTQNVNDRRILIGDGRDRLQASAVANMLQADCCLVLSALRNNH